MSVKKIFVLLITIVAIVLVGAFVLNTLLPNVTMTIIDAAEDLLYSVTGLNFDFNNNGNDGQADGLVGTRTDDTIQGDADFVEGWDGGGS